MRRLRTRRSARSSPARCASSASTSSSMPARRRHRGHRDHRGARSPASAAPPQVGPGARRHLAEIGLGDHQHVGDLHDPGLEELQDVAGSGLDDDGHGVGDVGDLGLRLADADGLDDHDVKGAGERGGGGAGGGRQAAEAVAGRGGADEDGVVGGVALDPRAVAEQRAARAPRAGVHGQHRHRPRACPPRGHQPRQQRRLADAGRPGDADDEPGRLAAQRGGGDRGQQRLGLLAGPRAPALDQVQDRRGGGQGRRAQPGAELRSIGRGAALKRGRRCRRRGVQPPARRCRASSR